MSVSRLDLPSGPFSFIEARSPGLSELPPSGLSIATDSANSALRRGGPHNRGDHVADPACHDRHKIAVSEIEGEASRAGPIKVPRRALV